MGVGEWEIEIRGSFVQDALINFPMGSAIYSATVDLKCIYAKNFMLHFADIHL